MKVLLIIFSILVVSWADDLARPDEENFFENQKNLNEGNVKEMFENIIRYEIEELRKKLKDEGIPEYGFDSLDPLDIEKQRIQFDTPFELDVNASQLTEGLLGFEIKKLEIEILNGLLIIDFSVNWPLLITHYEYGLAMIFMEDEIYGNGQIDVSATDFSISGHIKISNEIIDEELLQQIEEMSINLSLGPFDYKITGLTINDEDASKLISDEITVSAQHKLKNYEKRINENMSALIELINELIVDNILYDELYLNLYNIFVE